MMSQAMLQIKGNIILKFEHATVTSAASSDALSLVLAKKVYIKFTARKSILKTSSKKCL